MLSKEDKINILRYLISYFGYLNTLNERTDGLAKLLQVLTDKFIADDGVKGE